MGPKIKTVASLLVDRLLLREYAEATMNDLMDMNLIDNVNARKEFQQTRVCSVLVSFLENEASIDIKCKCCILIGKSLV
jgi:hypothetical protein